MQGNVSKTLITALEVALVLAILIVGNFVAGQYFVRLDLTEDKEYTISPSTRSILGNLDDVVSVKAYFSSDLPPRLEQMRRKVADVLDEYRNYGEGHINVEWIDPAKDPELEQQMRFLGIPQVQAQVLDKDQLQVKNVYMGIAVQYGEKRQAIPIIQDTYTLEYDLTSAILRITLDEEKVLGFLTGQGIDLDKQYQGIRRLLGEQYEVRVVNLDSGRTSIPEEIHTLIIPSPEGVTDREKYEIDQFIMRGGRAIFLIDAIRLNEQAGLQAQPVTSGLEDLLANFGVRVQKAIVQDTRFNTHASFSNGYMQYSVPYPFWPKISGPFLARDQVATSRLESLVLPWPAPMKLDVPIAGDDPLLEALSGEDRARAPELDGSGTIRSIPQPVGADSTGADEAKEAGESEAEGAPVRAYILARTSPYSETQTGRYDLTPSNNPFQPRNAKIGKSYVVAAALEGRFNSYYADRPAPSADGSEAGPDSLAEATKIKESAETQIIVLGNSFFLQDSFLGQFPENAVFFNNAVDWLTLGPELIGIRSRGATDRPLKEISDGVKTTLKVVLTLGPALLVIVLGLIRTIARRRRRAAVEADLRSAAGQRA